MSDHHLHIISFDVPYPANYGGVIDVFHKIRTLHALGVKIHLHCFQYGRKKAPELEKYCVEVCYYPRKTGFLSAFSLKPFIVISRRSPVLMENLLKDNHPILFEGLHSCYYIGDQRLSDRFKIYRESNIEHHYYYHLFKVEKNLFRKIYFLTESIKLRYFESQLKHASIMLTVSLNDLRYLSSKFPGNKVEYLPSFHANDRVSILPGKGNFILYHGNLGVGENKVAAEFLIRNVFSALTYPVFIAGLNPGHDLISLTSGYDNISIISNPPEREMERLIREAQINIMVTFQPTGLKLKLLNALFIGRFCVVNPEMTEGTDLAGLCETGHDALSLQNHLTRLMEHSFDETMIAHRRDSLMKIHSNRKNGESLLNLVSLYM